jgi:hypothetical protein
MQRLYITILLKKEFFYLVLSQNNPNLENNLLRKTIFYKKIPLDINGKSYHFVNVLIIFLNWLYTLEFFRKIVQTKKKKY